MFLHFSKEIEIVLFLEKYDLLVVSAIVDVIPVFVMELHDEDGLALEKCLYF